MGSRERLPWVGARESPMLRALCQEGTLTAGWAKVGFFPSSVPCGPQCPLEVGCSIAPILEMGQLRLGGCHWKQRSDTGSLKGCLLQ